MTYITYAPVDRQFAKLERDCPPGAPFNGVDPITGITFGFALESRYPLPAGEPDIRYGTVVGSIKSDPDILLRVITKQEYDAAHASEMAARDGLVSRPGNADVDAEHDRRTLIGRAFPVDGIGDVPLEGSERTQVVLLALKDTARDLRDAGITDPLLMLTDRDGVDRRLTATQMIALVNAGKAWMQQVHEAKRALKAMEPIPSDFADNSYWPPLD